MVIDKVVDAPYISGAMEFISNYHNIYDMYISTATPANEIDEIIKRKKLTKYFKGIKGSPESKVKHVRQIIRKNKYLQNEIIFIGDSDTDRQAASQNNIPFIAVLSGVGLESQKYKINDLNELIPLLHSFKY